MAYLLKDIIKNCSPYFKSTTIVDTGATDDTAQLPVNVINLHDWNDDWVKAYMTAIRDVPMGDWFLFMDSDEFPNLKLCQDIQELVKDYDAKGFNQVSLRGFPHLYDWDGNLEYRRSDPNWRKFVLVKKLSTTYSTAVGGHCAYYQKEQKVIDTPPQYFYNHVKSKYTVARSPFAHGFRFPHSFSYSPEDVAMIEAFKAKTGLRSCADFMAYLEGPMDDCDAFKVWEGPQDCSERINIYDILIKHKKKQFKPIFCNGDCCKY